MNNRNVESRHCRDVEDDGIMPTKCYPCFDIAAMPRFYIVSRIVFLTVRLKKKSTNFRNKI